MSKLSVTMVPVVKLLLLLLLAPPASAARAHISRRCDVRVNQTAGAPQSDGTKLFDVAVTNESRRPLWDVHLSCGYRFRSVQQVDPGLLVQLRPGDCLLINGGAIAPGGRVSYSYSSYVRYAMTVVSATCAGP